MLVNSWLCGLKSYLSGLSSRRQFASHRLRADTATAAVEVLENRDMKSATAAVANTDLFTFPDGSHFVPFPIALPRTGGVAVQHGSLLTLDVAKRPEPSTIKITDDGKGDFTLQWDHGAVHSFSGVKTLLVIDAARGTDNVDYKLTGHVTGKDYIGLDLNGRHNSIIADVSASGPTETERERLAGKVYNVVESVNRAGQAAPGLEFEVHTRAGTHSNLTTT